MARVAALVAVLAAAAAVAGAAAKPAAAARGGRPPPPKRNKLPPLPLDETLEATPAPTPTPTPTPPPPVALPANTSSVSALSSYLQAQSKRHAYGHLFVRGAPRGIEFFR
jgi:hypothetical protein